MIKNCECGKNHLKTKVEDRFVFHYCSACDDITNVVYLGPKEEVETFHFEEL